MRSISLSLKVARMIMEIQQKGDRDRPATSALGRLDMQEFMFECPYLSGTFFLFATLIMPDFSKDQPCKTCHWTHHE